jgi:hypothetical protein
MAAEPKPGARDGVAFRHDRVCEIELPVKLERSRVDRQRSRGGSGPGRLVDDPDRDALFRQPEGEDQSGWAGADDQHARIGHGATPSSVMRIAR